MSVCRLLGQWIPRDDLGTDSRPPSISLTLLTIPQPMKRTQRRKWCMKLTMAADRQLVLLVDIHEGWHFVSTLWLSSAAVRECQMYNISSQKYMWRLWYTGLVYTCFSDCSRNFDLPSMISHSDSDCPITDCHLAHDLCTPSWCHLFFLLSQRCLNQEMQETQLYNCSHQGFYCCKLLRVDIFAAMFQSCDYMLHGTVAQADWP